MNEVFFPAEENVTSGLGSCYYINHGGKARYHETNDICLGYTNRLLFQDFAYWSEEGF
jgi:hypothetical protein